MSNIYMGIGISKAGATMRFCGAVAAWLCISTGVFGEAMIQYFNANWNEVAAKVPELAEAGYTSIWLPPPTKAASSYSVGYDLVDPFDLGNVNQRGSVATLYGTKAEMDNLVEVLHRFGIKVYFDNIMNHRGFDVPGYDENTPIDLYPGMVPEDFHMRTTADGFYRRSLNTGGIDGDADWSDVWRVWYLSLNGLLDIAHESPNGNFGVTGGTHAKPVIVRHPNNPEFYDRMPHPGKTNQISNSDIWDFSANNTNNLYVGFGNQYAASAITEELVAAYPDFFDTYGTNGLTKEIIADFPEFFKEDVGGYLLRNVRWVVDQTKADGLRLDAVKHVPYEFFGQMGGDDVDSSHAGYLGNVQWQFNITHGFDDWDNHRNSVFNNDIPRDDAMLFGEHLGNQPEYGGYFATGMRLVDNPLRNTMNGMDWKYLSGFENPGWGGFGANQGVKHAQSHDNDYASCKELQHAFFMLGDGLGLIYTDGNNRVKADPGKDPFPRWAFTQFLGQWGDTRIPNLLKLNGDLARGWQRPVWGDNDNFVAWERLDWRQGGKQAADHVTMLVMLNSHYGEGRGARGEDFVSNLSFPHEAGGPYGADAYLYQYAAVPYVDFNPHFYKYASELGDQVVPPGAYYVFGYKNPDPSDLWPGDPLTIYDDGQIVDNVLVPRMDGADGDPDYNPYGVPDDDSTDFTYYMPIPRVTRGTNVTFGVRMDGSAARLLLRLDGGMDLNGREARYLPEWWGDPADRPVEMRDHPPGAADEIHLGFEECDADFFTQRIWPEKFAALNLAHSKIGSAGATTYEINFASSVTNIYEAEYGDNYATDFNQISWLYHNPAEMTDAAPMTNQVYADGNDFVIWVKSDTVGGAVMYLYYTLDGQTWPEGAGGYPADNATRVVGGAGPLAGVGGVWWCFTIPQSELMAVSTLRYKVGGARRQGYGGNGWDEVWPGGEFDVRRKTKMLTQWMITNQNLKTKSFHTHANYRSWTTNGLADGFHFLTARAFVPRSDMASIYKTYRQTFYLDTETPRGYIMYPSATDTQIGGSEYGAIVRTDATVTEVWYHITDNSDSNDAAGNGKVSNQVVWAQASRVNAWDVEMAEDTEYPAVWRFVYSRIPSSGTATIRVRLRELSSSDASTWSPDSPANDNAVTGHYTELTKVLNARGDAENFYFVWPDADGTMVQEGWEIRMRYTAKLAQNLSQSKVCDRMKVYINSTANGSTNRGELIDAALLNMTHEEWDYGYGNNENQIRFTMPNVYNGQSGWLYGIRVEFENEKFPGDAISKAATRLVQHRGALLPAVQIVTPIEVDSDGQKVIIQMKDVPAADIAANPDLRILPIVVTTDDSAIDLSIRFTLPSGYEAPVTQTAVVTNGNTKEWRYAWQVAREGVYRFEATTTIDNAAGKFDATTNTAIRNVTIQFIQLVDPSESSDWDDDGLLNEVEGNEYRLGDKYDAGLTQDVVFKYHAYGKSKMNSPDGDCDGLPDGLELGLREPMGSNTVTTTDTNGDGWPNFIADLDPPFYNTTNNYGKVPGVDSGEVRADRTKLVRGSVTMPGMADSDYDGLPDGIEDANRNGWVDGDGHALYPGQPRAERGEWPNGRMDSHEVWEETSPTIADSDGDGLSDGYGEDVNFNGRTDMFLLHEDGVLEDIPLDRYPEFGIGVDAYSTAHSSYAGTNNLYTSRAIDYAVLFQNFSTNAGIFTHIGTGPGLMQTNGWPRIVIRETDPLNVDTDGDGLPDGWEVRYGLDPLDNGIYSLRTGGPGMVGNGAEGDPDGDGFTNAMEYRNGTSPIVNDSIPPPVGEGTIHIGKGASLGDPINSTEYFNEFLDWKLDDLLALDDYARDGDTADIYRKGDGFDSSRDMVAFYFRDGGSVAAGGDDKLYFRVDFDDLKAYAEESALNIYVAINFGNYGVGELNLPDEVDAGSKMRWNACVGVYDSSNGKLWIDNDVVHNTEKIGESLNASVGVEEYPEGYYGAYFSSELDAVAFSIDRRILLRLGWMGNPSNLLFQVYTTRGNTFNSGGASGGPGGGDNGGRNDFADTIGDDWLCSDNSTDYAYISANSYYTWCIGRDTSKPYTFNHVGKHVKLALIAHGNQAVEAGSIMQSSVDNGHGAGYQRLIKIHNLYSNAPVNLHITPTLAMALEWAEVGTENNWFSGPALNERIRRGIQRGGIHLLGSTFSDHILRYFDTAFNQANVERAASVLNRIYGDGGHPVVSTNVFWTPERVLDWTTLKQVKDMGFSATIYDQNTHLVNWYGRSAALGENAYKLHRLWLQGAGGGEVFAFPLANSLERFRFEHTDNGVALDLRRLYLRRARGSSGQIASIFSNWEESLDKDKADAYDRNLRWLANHPWIQIATLDEALAAERNESGHLFYRDIEPSVPVQSHNWIQHATNEDYDNWYYGKPLSSRHKGLAPKVFEVRIGELLPNGEAYGSMSSGILSNAWKTVSDITHPDVKRLAEEVLFASVFETAFHQEDNHNLDQWSFGGYLYPATSNPMDLEGFAWKAQGQTRKAALYAAVNEWATNTLTATAALARDVDLDGEDEYILQNNKIMAVFEAIGGRMVGAWLKSGTNVYQMVGNFVSMAYLGTEEEGAEDASNGYLDSRRTSALTDWEIGGTSYVNHLYTVTPVANGWQLVSPDGVVQKTVTLGDTTNAFHVDYAATASGITLRHGLAPNFSQLLVSGQNGLKTFSTSTAATIGLLSDGAFVSINIQMQTGNINMAASDAGDLSLNTVPMRNQAHTQQIEMQGNTALNFDILFDAERLNQAPQLDITPAPPVYTNAMGTTNRFTVTMSDADGDALTFDYTMDVADYGAAFTAPDANTRDFTWAITNRLFGLAGTTNIIHVTVDDGGGLDNSVVSKQVVIVIPYDANGNGIPDDWEWFHFGSLDADLSDDTDLDGMTDFEEGIAGTDPTNKFDYLGWTQMWPVDGGVEIRFDPLATGRKYWVQYQEHIDANPPQWTNAPNMPIRTNQWIDYGTQSVTQRMYRILVH